MAISNLPLGLNSRNFTYIRKNNFKRSKRIADDKVRSKKLFIKNNVPTTNLVAVFKNRSSIKNIEWHKLSSKGFVIKPSRGYGGEGILVFKSWNGETAVSSTGISYTREMIYSHLFDILEGVYSLQHLPDTAYIEELVTPTPFFRKLSDEGLPDIRIIVFRKIPIMAMIRVPTLGSEGKANLHLGAVGLAIELRTGISFNAIYKNKSINKIPNKKVKATGIKVPLWDEIMKIAVKAQDVSGLGYAGIDIVVDKYKGPLVLEVNARPGLSIQVVNNASLRTRLERVENLEVQSYERGIEISRNLFAINKLNSAEGYSSVLSVIENAVFSKNGKLVTIPVKLDTGAYRTSIDKSFAEELGFKVLDRKVRVTSASGVGFRPIVKISFKLRDKKINSTASAVDRSNLAYKMIVGRKDLKGKLISPEMENEEEDVYFEENIDENISE